MKKAYALQTAFEADENGFVNLAYGYSFDQFIHYVQTRKGYEYGIGLPEGFVPDTVFVLVNDEGEYVGLFNFRHTLNDFLRAGPGHVGFGIAPPFRRKLRKTRFIYRCTRTTRLRCGRCKTTAA